MPTIFISNMQRNAAHDYTHLKNTASTPSECSSARTTLPLSTSSMLRSAALRARLSTSPRSHRAIRRCIAAVSSRDTILLPPLPPESLLFTPPRLVKPTAPDRGGVSAPRAASWAEVPAGGLSSLGSDRSGHGEGERARWWPRLGWFTCRGRRTGGTRRKYHYSCTVMKAIDSGTCLPTCAFKYQSPARPLLNTPLYVCTSTTLPSDNICRMCRHHAYGGV